MGEDQICLSSGYENIESYDAVLNFAQLENYSPHVQERPAPNRARSAQTHFKGPGLL